MANLLARREPTSMQRQAKELVTKVGEADPNGRQQRIPIASIRPNPNQPRKNIDQVKDRGFGGQHPAGRIDQSGYRRLSRWR